MAKLSGTTNLDREFKMFIVRVTNRAILAHTKHDDLNKHWLPFSQITIIDHEHEDAELTDSQVLERQWYTVQIPLWLAEQREII